MNTALIAVAHPTIKDVQGVSILKNIESKIEDNNLTFEINTKMIPLPNLSIMRPGMGEESRKVDLRVERHGTSIIKVNLEGVKTYAVVQSSK